MTKTTFKSATLAGAVVATLLSTSVFAQSRQEAPSPNTPSSYPFDANASDLNQSNNPNVDDLNQSAPTAAGTPAPAEDPAAQDKEKKAKKDKKDKKAHRSSSSDPSEEPVRQQ